MRKKQRVKISPDHRWSMTVRSVNRDGWGCLPAIIASILLLKYIPSMIMDGVDFISREMTLGSAKGIMMSSLWVWGSMIAGLVFFIWLYVKSLNTPRSKFLVIIQGPNGQEFRFALNREDCLTHNSVWIRWAQDGSALIIDYEREHIFRRYLLSLDAIKKHTPFSIHLDHLGKYADTVMDMPLYIVDAPKGEARPNSERPEGPHDRYFRIKRSVTGRQ